MRVFGDVVADDFLCFRACVWHKTLLKQGFPTIIMQSMTSSIFLPPERLWSYVQPWFVRPECLVQSFKTAATIYFVELSPYAKGPDVVS